MLALPMASPENTNLEALVGVPSPTGAHSYILGAALWPQHS
jgi:hypothetical protein